MKHLAFLMVFAALFIGCGGNETIDDRGHGGESVTTSTVGGGGGQSTSTSSTTSDSPAQCPYEAKRECESGQGTIVVSPGYQIAEWIPFEKTTTIQTIRSIVIHNYSDDNGMGGMFLCDYTKPQTAYFAIGDAGSKFPPAESSWQKYTIQVSPDDVDPTKVSTLAATQDVSGDLPTAIDPSTDRLWLIWESGSDDQALQCLQGCADPNSGWNSVIRPPGGAEWFTFGPGLGVECGGTGTVDCTEPAPPKQVKVLSTAAPSWVYLTN